NIISAFLVLYSQNMLRLRPSLGSSRFPDSGNVRVNILVEKRGAYGLNLQVQSGETIGTSTAMHI
ncbi:hypothetical protein NLN91_04255, partial [Citrobacter portucalensis]